MRTNQEYLLADQYKNAANISARADLHTMYSVNKYSWQRWVFDHIKVEPDARVLELGCGPAWLWAENLDRVPDGWDVTLSDFSPGMVDEARRNLGHSQRPFALMEIDAQAIPFDGETFDAVIANHVLYHVPDRQKAYAEINRVLKSDGRLYAATNGVDHMRELTELVTDFDPNSFQDYTPGDFSLENGADELHRWFTNVDVFRRPNELLVTNPDPLVAYAQSTQRLSDDKLPKFYAYVEQQMELNNGAIRITTASGVFVARGKV